MTYTITPVTDTYAQIGNVTTAIRLCRSNERFTADSQMGAQD